MIQLLYSFFLYPFAFLILQISRPFLNKKARQMIADRNSNFFEIKNKTAEEISSQRPFWIHAASGEIEYARPVIRELKQRFPEIPIIVTYSSPSAKKIIRNLDEVDAWGTLPWDFKSQCQNFINRWQPRCFLIARTDVWPRMASACRENKIPSLLFSATFAENSSRLRGFSARINAWALNQLSEIHCVAKEDVTQLERLQLQVPVHIHGDSRFDQVFHRLENPKPLRRELQPAKDSRVLVAGSTWPEDEEVLLPAMAAVKNTCKLILAPHEIHENHLEKLEEKLTSLDLSYCRYSTATAWEKEQVLLVDTVGILAELYTWGKVAFVGGSFRKQVHSVMEPLAAGLPVLVGPLHHNNREALLFKTKMVLGASVVNEVKTPEEMSALISTLCQIPAHFPKELHQELSQYLHASQSIVDWCAQRVSL